MDISIQLQDIGYAIVEDFLSASEVQQLKNEMKIILAKELTCPHQSIFTTVGDQQNFLDDYFLTSGDKVRCFYEEAAFDTSGNLTIPKEKAINKVGHALHKLSQTFRKMTFSNKIKNLIKELGLVQPIVTQTMYIFKQPKIGGEVAGHQDGTYLATSPMNGVGLWIALDDAEESNGCLHFIPKSHLNGLTNSYKLVRTETKDGIRCIYQGEPPLYQKSSFVPVPAKSGTLILIDALVVHRSEKNSSDEPRNAFTVHIYDGHRANWDVHNWIQPTSNENFEELNKVHIEE